jgi:hypothetical protein
MAFTIDDRASVVDRFRTLRTGESVRREFIIPLELSAEELAALLKPPADSPPGLQSAKFYAGLSLRRKRRYSLRRIGSASVGRALRRAWLTRPVSMPVLPESLRGRCRIAPSFTTCYRTSSVTSLLAIRLPSERLPS